MKRYLIPVILLAGGVFFACSSGGSGRPGRSATPQPTPTPSLLSRVNPNIVEETETYFIERIPKKGYIREDDRHIRHPILGVSLEFFKEDANYYYVQRMKTIPEEQELLRRQAEQKAAAGSAVPGAAPAGPSIPPSEFADLAPARVAKRLRLEEVKDSGLPTAGMWRSSFVIADVNGDGIPDVVAPPARLGGESILHVWIGDGKGRFTRWPLVFTERGQPKKVFSMAYGGVAVGDIDGDGNMDVAAASHGGGLVALLGNGKGSFEIVKTGLPDRAFSSQAIVLVDADGDGKLDIVASGDTSGDSELGVDKQQVRVYLFRGSAGWEAKKDGIVGGLYSNSLRAWDYDGDGAKDVLTGSHYLGGPTLLWKNERNGTFSYVYFPEIEKSSYHFAAVPGTFGRDRAPAFAATVSIHTNEPQTIRAAGINVYSHKGGAWSRHRVWRKKNGDSLLYALAMGDLDGDGLDDLVFPDSEQNLLRVFFQEPDGSFREMDQKEEPRLDSPGQCVQIADIDGDGRPDIVLSKTVSSTRPHDRGGWSVFLNRR
ncbi:MAG TPA: VCBS repeat-containing protein [Thermoanaerobaculia bacterium]